MRIMYTKGNELNMIQRLN